MSEHPSTDRKEDSALADWRVHLGLVSKIAAYTTLLAVLALLTILQFFTAAISSGTGLSPRLQLAAAEVTDAVESEKTAQSELAVQDLKLSTAVRPTSAPLSVTSFKSVSASIASSWDANSNPIAAERRFIGATSCIECHAPEYESWLGSDHQLAMQDANPIPSAEHFNGESFERHGITTTFSRDDQGRGIISETQTNGSTSTFPVQYIFGLHPLQQFVIPFPGGRFQLYTLAWDTQQKEWFDLYPDEEIKPTDELHWQRHNFNWNLMCVECHTTDLQKNYDPKTNSYATTYSANNVSCEACHGPASQHVELARTDPEQWGGDFRRGLSLALKDVPINRMQIDVCAQCHARRQRIKDDFLPGKRFTNYFAPEFLEEELYFVDGQIKDEVFVYGSFLQSRMYRENVKCSDCHDPHSNRLKMVGNALCTQCHVAADFDTPMHSFHPAGSAGASCVACHMPERNYMIVDPRRDHAMKVPRPDLTVLYDTPNACNDCHTKESESAEWAAARIVEWYGPDRPDEPHFAHAFTKARAGDPAAPELLRQVVSDSTKYGPIVRGTAAAMLGPYLADPGTVAFLKKARRDRDELVRAGVVRALDYAEPTVQLELLPPMLKDRSRLVRVQAARILASYPNEEVPEKYRKAHLTAIREFEEAQLVNADSPGGQLNLGVLYTDLKDPDRAKKAYSQALRIEPIYVPALVNLALLNYDTEKPAEARRLLRLAVTYRPDFIEGHFMLGLLLAEDPASVAEAMTELTKAGELAPDRPDIQYNLGLLHHSARQVEVALTHLQAAVRLSGGAVEMRYALMTVLIDAGRFEEALAEIDAMARGLPDNPRWEQLRDYVNSLR